MDRPRVDVGVVTWNTRDMTVQALRRLLDSDQGCEIRLLVRDNGSTDGTPEAIAEHVPEAEVEHDVRNLGFAGGMNRLIRRSTAPWFLLLNPDAWPEPGAIATLVARCRSHARIAAVAPLIRRPDGSQEHSALAFPSLEISAIRALGLSRIVPRRVAERMLLPPKWALDHATPVDWAVGAALLVPRAAFEEVGLLDESFFMYAEDLDWCWRARDKGWEVWFDPRAVVVHVGNASGEQAYGARRTRAHLHNAYRVYERRHGRAATVLLRTLNVVAPARMFLRATLRRNRDEATWWRAHVAAQWRALDGAEETPRDP